MDKRKSKRWKSINLTEPRHGLGTASSRWSLKGDTEPTDIDPNSMPLFRRLQKPWRQLKERQLFKDILHGT